MNVTASPLVKAISFLLAVLFLALAAVSGAASIYVSEGGYYEQNKDRILHDEIFRILRTEASNAISAYVNGTEQTYDANFRYAIYDAETNECLLDATAGEDPILTFSTTFRAQSDDGSGTVRACRIVAGVSQTLSPEGELWAKLQLTEFLWSTRYRLPIATVLSLIFGILFTVICCCGAARRRGKEEPTPNAFERLPFDLLFIVLAIIFAGMLWIFVTAARNTRALAILPSVGSLTLLGMIACALFALVGFAARIKTGGLLRETLLFRIFRTIARLFSLLRERTAALPRVSLIAGAVCALNLILGVSCFGSTEGSKILFAVGATETVVFSLIALALAWSVRQLRNKTSAVAQGNSAETSGAKPLFPELRKCASDLDRIRDGVTQAVNEKMKSEKMKTDLISNVSHDLKTPLTSIVNYVDLLSREVPESEHSAQYLEILKRQSSRLKRLTEDIVEASKASSGSLPLNIEKCDLKTLLQQAEAEYRERLSEREIESVLTLPEESVYCFSDGQKLWRIFDNLLNNIRKYSAPHSRAYLSLTRDADRAIVIFRNVSEQALNISAEELTERFVRGDASRTGEGSGLGLSIAKSLTELLQGSFELTVDGDLFKVILTFTCTDLTDDTADRTEETYA